MFDIRSKTLAKNTLYLYIRMIFVLFVNLYASRIILRVLGVDDFGIFNLVGSVVVFLGFFQSALTNATYRFLAYELGAKNYDRLSLVYSMAINCHVLLALLLWAIMEIGGVWFINNKLVIPEGRLVAANWLYQFSLLTFVLSIIRTPYNSNIIAHEKMDFYAIISIIEAILKLIILYVLSISPFDKLISYGFLLSVVSALILIFYIFYCKYRIQDTTYYKCWDLTLLKKFATYSGWSLFVNTADMTTSQCISVFFNWFVGIIANAAIGVMNQVNAGLNLFVNNFSQAFNPQLIKSYAAKEYDYFMQLIFSTSKISYILYLIVALPISLNIHYVLTLWLGEYPDLSPDFILATLLYYLVDSMQSPLFNAVHATGNIKYHHIIVGTLKLLAIPCMYMVLRIGYSGVEALLIWSVSNVIVAIARTIYMHHLINLDLKKYLTKVVLPLIALTCFLYPIEYLLVSSIEMPFLSLFVSVISSAILILFFSIIFIFDNKERELLFSLPILNKLKNKLSWMIR